ncbi:MAG: type II toxin-antitoxin system VapC family toxin [Deltaproteobacteria bacterium]|nr:type II toxin-antitoxin system VapC family toxin [Deltaproteobacteria bacterium]
MIVLDTHTWVWFVSDPANLSGAAKHAIESSISHNGLFISSISVWEVALLVAKKRMAFSMDVVDWISMSERMSFFQFVPIDNRVALKSVHLPQPIHQDPADRIIIATAIVLGAPVVTKDVKLLKYPHVETIW